MKDIPHSHSSDLASDYKNQSTPQTPQSEKPKITFPNEPKKVENPSLDKNGKHKTKRNVDDKQPQLWTSQN